MNIVFMGTPAFACPALEALAKSDHEVVRVVTGQDKPSGRGKKVHPTEISQLAKRLTLPVSKPLSLNDDSLYQELRSVQPDLIVVIAFRILPKRLFELPSYGAINIHASLLPKYRGAAPINWALINGEQETGLSAFYLKKKVDTGDIIHQEKIAITHNENFDSLYQRLSEQAAPFLLDTISLIASGKARPISQDNSLASAAPKLTPFDAMIDFGFPAEHVHNFIRGMSSRPGAYTYFRGQKLKILEAKQTEFTDPEITRPGAILKNRKQLIVRCAHSAIELTSVVPQGKKPMDGVSFLNGFKPERGEILGEVPQGSIPNA